jgi:hypothetical protein
MEIANNERDAELSERQANWEKELARRDALHCAEIEKKENEKASSRSIPLIISIIKLINRKRFTMSYWQKRSVILDLNTRRPD